MWQSQYAVYLGRETETGFSGFISVAAESENGNSVFLTLEATQGLDKETGRKVITEIKQSLSVQKISNLADLDSFVGDQIKKHNLPANICLSIGVTEGNVIYLKTIGEGLVFIKRNNNFEKIIDNNQTASGYLEKNDYFIFTTNRFIQLFSHESIIKTIFDHKSPHQIVEDLVPSIKDGNDQGAIALFVQFNQLTQTIPEEKNEEIIVSEPLIVDKSKNLINNYYQKFIQFKEQGGKKRILTFIVIIALILILFWSVGLGVTRRNESLITGKINRSRELITQKLDQADEIAFLNLAKSQSLISEAKKELATLKKDVGDNRKELAEIDSLIKEKENKILNKEEKKAEEVYDLTVDNKAAQGTRISLDGDNLIILDNKQGIIYQLSLSKKSLDNIADSQIKSASLIANYQTDIFFFIDGKGVYKANKESKPKLVIEADSEWGKISGMTIYNGNIYLLDTKKNEIYKYLAAEDKYGSKSPYFKSGEGVELSDATSMAIDSALYIGFKNSAVKYTAGVKDIFNTTFPEENITLTKIITNKDLEKVYGWDKDNGAIYILGKNGTYERQIKSSALAGGSDVVVFDNSAYVLNKEKIYRVSLD